MKKLLVVGVIAVIGFAGWRMHSRAKSIQLTQLIDASDGKSLLVDRLWIDHLPRSERDTVNIFALFDEHSVGVFDQRSVWRGQFEAFRYETSGNKLRIEFPHTGNKLKVTAKARRCHEGDMEFCLDIEGADRGAKRYYSREGWEIGTVKAERDFVTKLLPNLAPNLLPDLLH